MVNCTELCKRRCVVLQKIIDFGSRRIAYIVYGIVVFSRKIVYFKGKNGQDFVYIAADFADASLFPSPDFGSYIIVNGKVEVLFHPRCDVQIESGIVDQDNGIGTIR